MREGRAASEDVFPQLEDPTEWKPGEHVAVQGEMREGWREVVEVVLGVHRVARQREVP